jgi:hypothetical protein
MKIDRRELLRQLESVQPGLSSKENLDQSNCFAFTPGLVTTFNDEICCRQDTTLDFKGAVNATKLLQLLRHMSEDEIDVSVLKDTELSIKGSGRRAGIKMQQDILLPHHVVKTPTDWEDCVPAVGDYIGMVADTAAKENPEFIYTCVRIAPDCMEATDAYQAIRCEMPISVASEVIVKKAGCKALDGMGIAAVAEDDNWLHWKTYTGLVLSLRKQVLDNPYPDLTAIFEAEENGEVQLPGTLLDSLEKASVFSTKTASGKQVCIKLKPGKMLLRAADKDGYYEELVNVDYTGENVSFGMSIVYLQRILSQALPCLITDNTVRIEGEGFKMVMSLENVV